MTTGDEDWTSSSSTRCGWSDGYRLRRRNACCPAATRSAASGSPWRVHAARAARVRRVAVAGGLAGVRGWNGRVRRSAMSWRGRRRRRGQRFAASPVLPDRCRDGVSGGGRRGVGSTPSSRRLLRSTPSGGFGWKDVAFSGRSRSGAHDCCTWSKRGAGSRTAVAVPGSAWSSASAAWWWWVTRVGPCASAGMICSCRVSTSTRPREVRTSSRSQRGRRWQPGRAGARLARAAERWSPGRPRTPPRRLRPRRRRRLEPSSDPVDGAEEQGGVALVDQHGQPAVPAALRVTLLQSQVGRVAVVPVGDEGAGRGQEGRDRAQHAGIVEGPQAVGWPARSTKATGAWRARCSASRRRSGRGRSAPAGSAPG